MARRLLGADNAATVFNTQQTEEEPVTQVHTLSNLLHLYQYSSIKGAVCNFVQF